MIIAGLDVGTGKVRIYSQEELFNWTAKSR
jgi:hypothetical protein